MGISFEQLNYDLQRKIPYEVEIFEISKDEWVLNEDDLYHCRTGVLQIDDLELRVKLYLNGTPVLFDYDIITETDGISIDMMIDSIDSNNNYYMEIKLYN